MNLNAEWITGFVDGEGCFHVGIARHEGMSVGVQILPEFTVVQHGRDAQLLHAIKAYFGCGVVRTNHGDRMAHRVKERKQLNERIVPFFVEHPLQSKKRVDFEKFRDALLMMEKDEHLTEEASGGSDASPHRMNRGTPR